MAKQHKALTIVGWILTALIFAMLAFSATMKFMAPPQVADMFTGKFGYPKESLTPIGVTELACAVVFLFPRTAMLGAVLLTGYLGGAVATHVRVLDPFISPLVVGAAVWLALFCREPRLRALFPWLSPRPCCTPGDGAPVR